MSHNRTYAFPGPEYYAEEHRLSAAAINSVVHRVDQTRTENASLSYSRGKDTLTVGDIFPEGTEVHIKDPLLNLPEVETESDFDPKLWEYIDFTDATDEPCPCPPESISRRYKFEFPKPDVILNRKYDPPEAFYASSDSYLAAEKDWFPGGVNEEMEEKVRQCVGPHASYIAFQAALDELNEPDDNAYKNTHPARGRNDPDAPFPCPIIGCTRAYTIEKSRAAHLTTHFKGQYICPGECKTFFRQPHELIRHCENSEVCSQYFDRYFHYKPLFPEARWHRCDIRYLRRPAETDPFRKKYDQRLAEVTESQS